nr:NucA/NucB deoxyribonuclease domain-containing protein [Amycolatopsis umgeniensis]
MHSDEAASPQAPEKVLRNNFGLVGYAYDDAGIYVELDGKSQPNFRCDSAGYFATPACVFTDVIPRLNYVYGDNYDEVVDHIRRAQNNPDVTHPPKPGKVIPGKYPPTDLDSGLYRVEYEGSTWRKNRGAKNTACATLPPPQKGQDCDEYPIASTKQGAGFGDGNFSVEYLDEGHNRRAGGKLPGYYSWDRILYWDNATKPPLDQFRVKAGQPTRVSGPRHVGLRTRLPPA